MCHGILAEQAEPGRSGAGAPTASPHRLRPRVIAGAATALVASLAAAALLTPPPSATAAKQEAAATAALVVAARSLPPAGGAIEQTSSAMDDGVPAANGVTRHEGDCHHGL
jgi:hypothetical protein